MPPLSATGFFRGVAQQQSVRFGTVRSQVQSLSPRPRWRVGDGAVVQQQNAGMTCRRRGCDSLRLYRIGAVAQQESAGSADRRRGCDSLQLHDRLRNTSFVSAAARTRVRDGRDGPGYVWRRWLTVYEYLGEFDSRQGRNACGPFDTGRVSDLGRRPPRLGCVIQWQESSLAPKQWGFESPPVHQVHQVPRHMAVICSRSWSNSQAHGCNP